MEKEVVYNGFIAGASGGAVYMAMSYIRSSAVDWSGGLGFMFGFAAAFILFKWFKERR